jgi:putative permease
MPSTPADPLYRSLAKAITYAACVVIFLWLLYNAAGSVLLLLFVLVLGIVINAPVAALEKRGMRRGWACLLVFGCILLMLGLLGWLIIPRVSGQITTLIDNLPTYANQLSKNISGWFSDYPQINKEIQQQGVNLSQWLPSVPKALMSIGNYSLSILASLLILVLFTSMVVYAVANPRPLLHLYFSFFPLNKREQATEALMYTSVMLRGWIKANIIGGSIRGACLTIFLSVMNVPGAFVWGAIAFFSELIPKLGFYTMAIPPILVALSVSPMTALWTTIFILALDSVLGDMILPRIRAGTMNIHPVSIMFVFLAMAAVFGFMGALLATPLTAIVKAYYETFYLKPMGEDKKLEERVEDVLYKK